MKFMVEVRLRPGDKNKAVEAFETRGPNRNLGVSFHGAWIGKDTDLVFVLVESADQASVERAGQTWRELGDFQIHSVINVEDF